VTSCQEQQQPQQAVAPTLQQSPRECEPQQQQQEQKQQAGAEFEPQLQQREQLQAGAGAGAGAGNQDQPPHQQGAPQQQPQQQQREQKQQAGAAFEPQLQHLEQLPLAGAEAEIQDQALPFTALSDITLHHVILFLRSTACSIFIMRALCPQANPTRRSLGDIFPELSFIGGVIGLVTSGTPPNTFASQNFPPSLSIVSVSFSHDV
jgi:hypothetical protein